MEIKKFRQNTIRRLKEIKEEQGLSISKIIEMLEEHGQYVSEATLKKVFSDGSEDKTFRMQDTIVPLADVLFDIYGDKSGLDDVESLRQIIKEKNKMIDMFAIKLEEQNETYASKERLYEDRKAIYEKHIAHLEEQIVRLQSAAERKDAMIENLVSTLLKLKSE